VNAKVTNSLSMLLVLLVASLCNAESATQAIRSGNQLFSKKDWQGAMSAYDRAAAIDPASKVPQYNKSAALYESGDYKGAADGLQKVAAESRDLSMVARAKYNLANCAFKEGMRQKDSDLQKAVGSIKQAITGWRDVLAIQPDNSKAKDNLAKAALVLKQLMDEQKKRQQEQKNDPNQQQQGQDQQKQDPNNPGQQDQQKDDQKDKDQKDKQQQNSEEQKKQQEQKEGKEQPKAQERKDAPDATAEQILSDEQDRKQNLRPDQSGYQPVDQDW
jgi:Ca-activated chloride channel homolog